MAGSQRMVKWCTRTCTTCVLGIWTHLPGRERMSSERQEPSECIPACLLHLLIPQGPVYIDMQHSPVKWAQRHDNGRPWHLCCLTARMKHGYVAAQVMGHEFRLCVDAILTSHVSVIRCLFTDIQPGTGIWADVHSKDAVVSQEGGSMECPSCFHEDLRDIDSQQSRFILNELSTL